MGKKNRKSKSKVDANETTAFDNPFAGLSGLRDALPEGDAPEEPTADLSLKTDAENLRISTSSKGRRGKTVTLVNGISSDELAALAKQIGKKLGTGTSVEHTTLVIQGDQTKRIGAVLDALLGATK